MAIAQPETEPAIQPAPERVTPRAFVLGLITVVGMCVYAQFYRKHLAIDFLPLTALLPLVTWIGLNILLRTLFPRLSLSRTEMLAIFGIVWLPAVMWATSAYLIGVTTAPAHYASPENRFWEVGWPHLPHWMFLDRSEYVLDGFFRGLAPGDPIPWGPWITPLFWWLTGILGMVMTGFFASVIFYRQWADQERLTFPLATVPQDLLRVSGGGRVPDVMKSWVFWMGFACTGGVVLWNIAGYFVLHMPRITIYDQMGTHVVNIGRGFPPYYLRLQPLLMGIAYHCPLNLLFTFWIFYPLKILKEGFMNRVGFSVGLEGQPATPGEILSLEANGALFFLVAWSIWIARHHLRNTLRKAFSGPRSEDDGLPVSYRAAWLGFILCGIFMVSLLVSIGFSPAVAIVHLILAFVAYFGVSKYSAATGFFFLRPQGGKGGRIIQTLWGLGNLRPGDLAGLAIVNNQAFAGGGARILAIPATPHFFRLLGDSLRRHPLIWGAVPAAVLTAFVTSMGTSISLGYLTGKLNVTGGTMPGWGGFLNMVSVLEGSSLSYFDPQKLAVWIFGGVETGVLTYLMSRFPGWPIHPLGLAFPQFYGFSIFLVWLPKYLIVRFGGVHVYRRSIPFWYGFIVGYLVGVGLSTVVDMIWFPASMHWVYGW